MNVPDYHDLTTTEKYLLAHILVCGAISEKEFQGTTKFNKTVREKKIKSLHDKGILDQTLFYYDHVKYTKRN